MSRVMNDFPVFVVTRNQQIDLVAGITVIRVIKDENAFTQTKLYFCRVGDIPGIRRRLSVSCANIERPYGRIKNP